MKMSVSPCIARSSPDRAADSSARTVVVPMATTRPPLRLCCVHGVDGRLRDFEPLLMHAVIGDAFDAHRLEGAGADVQRDAGALHTACVDLRQQRFVQMQRRGRCRHGAGLGGEDGLITAFVVGRVVVRDVRRQRYVAVALHQLEWVGWKPQAHQRVVGAAAAHHLRVEGVGQAQHLAFTR